MGSSIKHSPTPPRAAPCCPGTAHWCCWLPFLGVLQLLRPTKLGQWIDEAALLGGEAFLAADKTRGPALAFLDHMPAASALLAGGFILFALVRRRDFLRPAVAGALLLGAAGSTQLLKHVVLVRPDLNISAASMNSFPSGHTTFAAAAMAAIFIVAPVAHRPPVALLGWGYAAIAGASTLVLGWHRPSDVIAAYLVVAWWSVLAGTVPAPCCTAVPRPRRPPATMHAAGAGAAAALRWRSLGALAVAAALALALAMPHPAIGTVGNGSAAAVPGRRAWPWSWAPPWSRGCSSMRSLPVTGHPFAGGSSAE